MVKAPTELLDIEKLIAELPLSAKADLLAGSDFWHTSAVEAYGIPKVRVSDGPNGVRGQKFFNGTPASCFPSSTGLAASFDVDMAAEVGGALADECKAKGAAVLLGPTSNIQRSPLGGRGFESFSEDPLLNGLITAGYINGLQAKGISATLKHFVCNDQEFERFSNDSVVSQRALREIYLEPFRLAMRDANPWGIMTSYNRVNGTHVSEHKGLVDDVLRKEWGFKGFVMSDWTGTYSTKEAIEAGLDLEMPGPTVMRGNAVMRMVNAEKLKIEAVDECVRNVLGMVNIAIKAGVPFDAEEQSIDTPELRALLRKTAQGAVVLLKNEASILPIKAAKKIAVIGSNAKVAVPSGGGSASLTATYTISPLEGITNAAKEIGADVEFAMGASAFRFLPLLDPYLSDAKVDFYLENPAKDFFHSVSNDIIKPYYSVATKSTHAFVIDSIPTEILNGQPRARYTATFTPDVSTTWNVSLASIGFSTLWIDGKLVVDNTEKNYAPGELWFNMGSQEVRESVQLEAGKAYKIEVRQWRDPSAKGAGPFIAKCGIRIGALPEQTVEAGIAEAVELAKKSDLAILVVGTNLDWESEGYDRKTIKLPGANDELVKAVLAANPKTVVVTQSGTPVAMPWLSDASTVVQAFFGGNELGNGMADVLFGKVNPSGKLPLTFPKRLEDNPAFHSFGITSETPGKSVYSEGVYVGYRHYERSQLEPLFPFGYGLSYTSFDISGLTVSSVSDSNEFTVSTTVKNTGSVDGAEIVQVYVAPPVEGRITSPLKELQAFTKVFLKAGESKKVDLKVGKEAFSYWDESADKWVAPAGSYEVLVGNASSSTVSAGSVELKKTFKWLGL